MKKLRNDSNFREAKTKFIVSSFHVMSSVSTITINSFPRSYIQAKPHFIIFPPSIPHTTQFLPFSPHHHWEGVHFLNVSNGKNITYLICIYDTLHRAK